MASPILPRGVLDDLRVMQEQGLTHRATVEHWVRTRLENGEEETSWEVLATNVPCLLVPMGPNQAQVAESQGIKAGWVFKERMSGPADPGDRALVTGSMGGVAFQHLVDLTGDLSGPSRVIRRLAAVDTDLSEV